MRSSPSSLAVRDREDDQERDPEREDQPARSSGRRSRARRPRRRRRSRSGSACAGPSRRRAMATTSTSAGRFSFIAIRLIISREWLRPSTADAEERPAQRQQLAEECVRDADDQECAERVHEPHVLEGDPAEEVPELAPDDELSRRVAEVRAQAEEVDVRRGRVLLGVGHDRDLVRADLDRPRLEPQQVERREGGDERAWGHQIRPRGPAEPAARHEQVRGDHHERGEPDPGDPAPPAGDAVDDDRGDADSPRRRAASRALARSFERSAATLPRKTVARSGSKV